VAGLFDRVGTIGRAGLVVLAPTGGRGYWEPAPVRHHAFSLAQNAPNPAVYSTLIRFTLSEAAQVALAVYDVQGRRVAVPIHGELQAAGPHEVELPTGSWPPGIYYYRVQAGVASATRKMAVVK